MLNVVSRQNAQEIILEQVKRKEGTMLLEPFSFVSGEDLFSPEDLPDHSRSTVDGFAVYASDTYGCSESIPAMLTYDGAIRMGELPEQELLPGHCMSIPTGGYLPKGADAVCMIEYADAMEDDFRYMLKPAAVSENVNRQGDDCRTGDLILQKGQPVTAKNIAVMAAVGLKEAVQWKEALLSDVQSYDDRKDTFYRVGILSTGDELIECEEPLAPGLIRNINSYMLAADVRQTGLLPVIYPIVKDEKELLEAAVKKALSECDAVCISGGTSVGERDNVYKVLSEKGEVLFHGISVKPGKPTMFAMVDGKPVFGLPGHPAAAFFIFELLIKPALKKATGQEDALRQSRVLPLSRKLSSNHGREEILPVKAEEGKAVPLRASSGVVSVLAKADGYILIDRNTEGLAEGTPVEVFLL